MLKVSRRVLVSAPRDSVSAYLDDLREIARCNAKVDRIDLTPSPDGAEASAGGRFLGLPWRGVFRVLRTRDGGYRAAMTRGPLRLMECGAALRPVFGGTVVEREEVYEFPLPLRPLSPLIRRWLGRSLETELGLIKEGAEATNRRLQLRRLDA